LMRLDKNSCSIDVFMPSEGLLSEEFNRLSHYQSADGRLWFGGIYGVNVFQPEQLELHKGPAPPLLFSKIEILRDRKWQILSGNVKNIELRSEDRSLYIEFIMPEYRHPNSIRYSYKMDGLDDDWHYTKDNALHFEELLPGKYVLRIRGQATGGIWAANELALPIRVFAPFYKRVEFYLIMGLLFTLSSYLFFQYRLTAYKNRQMALEKKVNERSKELLEKNKQLQHLDKIKNQLFAIIAHDMKNALVTFRGVAKKVAYLLKENQTQRLLNMGNNIDEASENLSSILDNLLHWAISEQGRMPYHPEKVNLRKIVDETIQLYAGMAQAKGVSLFNKVPKAATAFADAQSIGIILRNLIGNAIKYNHQGHHVFVMTTSAGNADKITLIVEDDGIGIPPGQLAAFSERDMSTRDENSQKGAGLGLMLTRMLIRQNGGEMKVESTPGRGTRVSLTMPVEAPPIKKRLPKQAL
ncbi:MAG TPA: HAMP domain-containing histidine kinase, partial [Bacteroidetes bacterium]|nr:HAMP domain-containing histidine kinase [Bacteroidota bacterium]